MSDEGLRVRIVCDGSWSKVWLNDQQLKNCVVAAEFTHDVDSPTPIPRSGGNLTLTLEVREFVFEGPVSVNHVLIHPSTGGEATE